jgi:hypothetical protein
MSGPSGQAPTTTTTAPTGLTMSGLSLPSPQVALPLIAILGYTAFLITGFGAGLGAAQPVPIYTYLGLLLLIMQAVISENRSATRLIYIFLTSGFAVIYAGFVIFDKVDNFARSPYFYFIVNLFLVVVFIYDAITRRRGQNRVMATAEGDPLPAQLHPYSFGSFATDFGGLAILMYIAYGLLRIITSIPFGATQKPIDLDLSQIGLNIPNIPTLQQLDLVIAVGATAVALLILGIVGVLAATGKGFVVVKNFFDAIRRIAIIAGNQVLLSLRLVLSPLVWLIPSFSIAVFSSQFTTYLNNSAASRTASIPDLFNPFSPHAQANYGLAFIQLGLGILAVAAVVLAVAVVEHDGHIIERTFEVLAAAGRTVALTLAIFTFSLAALNAFLVLIRPGTTEPFQVGGATLMALVAGVIFTIYATLRSRSQKPAPTEPGV